MTELLATSPAAAPSPRPAALIELGKLDRRTRLALHCNDEQPRRRGCTQHNRQESRHRLCRKVCHATRATCDGNIEKANWAPWPADQCLCAVEYGVHRRALEKICVEGRQIATVDIVRLFALGSAT